MRRLMIWWRSCGKRSWMVIKAICGTSTQLWKRTRGTRRKSLKKWSTRWWTISRASIKRWSGMLPNSCFPSALARWLDSTSHNLPRHITPWWPPSWPTISIAQPVSAKPLSRSWCVMPLNLYTRRWRRGRRAWRLWRSRWSYVVTCSAATGARTNATTSRTSLKAATSTWARARSGPIANTAVGGNANISRIPALRVQKQKSGRAMWTGWRSRWITFGPLGSLLCPTT